VLFARGLGKRFQREGYTIGYMRPVMTSKTYIAECVVDEEADLMRQTLGLTDPADLIWPVCLDPATVEAVLRGKGEDYAQAIMDAYVQVAKGKYIVLLEGGSRCSQGLGAGISADRIANMLQAQVLVVAKYNGSTVLVVDDLLADKERLGGRMIGAVLNAVQPSKLEFVEKLVVPFLEKHDIPVYATLPLDRVFTSVSVGELNKALDGEIICRPDLADELVESLMVGAMGVETALTHFRRRLNKAVITGADRPDIQLTAMETSTKCLILTGAIRPNPLIISRAEDAGVVLILVEYDTMTTVQMAESAFSQTSFHQPQKIERFDRLLGERFDFGRLHKALNLKQA